jgi:hypothetical protein
MMAAYFLQGSSRLLNKPLFVVSVPNAPLSHALGMPAMPHLFMKVRFDNIEQHEQPLFN